MNSISEKKSRRSGSATLPRLVLALVFLAGFAVVAVLTYTRVRAFVAGWEMTGLPGVTIHDATPTPGGDLQATPDEPPSLPLVDAPDPLPWDGVTRVTVLVMGLDYRDWEAGSGLPHTDTMMLLTIDPVSKTAGMLSVPRDLWVNIPGGFGYGRINTAYPLGEGNKLPGGGPELAMKTVEGLLGVPIDYYALIEFHAFEKFIDTIGGVKVDVKEKIQIDPLGDNNTKTLKPGRQTLPGNLALAYIRARKHAGDDFGRSQRQQDVIMAIRNQILSFDMVPKLAANSSQLYKDLSAGIHTNMSLDQVIRLAFLATQIPEGNIRRGAIAPPDMVTLAKSPDGSQEVLKPITENIRRLRDDIFTATGAIGPNQVVKDTLERMKAEGARVVVLNGTVAPDLATRTADYLRSQGINVTETGNAPAATATTQLTFFSGKPYTVGYLVEQMKINGFRIRYTPDGASAADVQLTLGDDWAVNNPMGQ